MNLPTWNLSEFYSSLKDDQINNDIRTLKKKIKKFSSKYKGKLKSLENNNLINSLADFEKIEEISLKLRSYGYLIYCTNQLDKDRSKFFQFIEETVLIAEKDIIFYGIELNNLSEKKISIFNNTKYKNWIKNHKKFKKFQKTESIEKILVEKSLTSSSAWVRFFDQTITRLRFNFKGNELTETEILDLLSSPKKKIRKEAAHVFGETLKNNIHYFSFIMNIISKDLDIDKNIRGFKFSESSRHLNNQIEKSDIDSLVDTATKNYK